LPENVKTQRKRGKREGGRKRGGVPSYAGRGTEQPSAVYQKREEKRKAPYDLFFGRVHLYELPGGMSDEGGREEGEEKKRRDDTLSLCPSGTYSSKSFVRLRTRLTVLSQQKKRKKKEKDKKKRKKNTGVKRVIVSL